jgi:hypothetical protein
MKSDFSPSGRSRSNQRLEAGKKCKCKEVSDMCGYFSTKSIK